MLAEIRWEHQPYGVLSESLSRIENSLSIAFLNRIEKRNQKELHFNDEAFADRMWLPQGVYMF
jgi:hypothetical protein